MDRPMLIVVVLGAAALAMGGCPASLVPKPTHRARSVTSPEDPESGRSTSISHQRPSASSVSEVREADDSWDRSSSTERISVLTSNFRRAVVGLRENDDSEHDLDVAQSALTALRPELYRTAEGKAEHRALEAELDAIAIAPPARAVEPKEAQP